MRRHRSTCVGLSLASIMLVGSLAGCGDDHDTSTTTTTSASTTTKRAEASTTTGPTTTTVEAVVAWLQARFDERYAESTSPSGVTGPSQLVCADTGPVNVGGVFACELRPQTVPGFDLETGGAVVYVLDASGRAAIDVATDIPSSTEGLMANYASVPKGLFCRDLLDQDNNTLYAFNQGFFWSLVYWSLEGEPDRMDADGNGIPCETLYEPAVIAEVLGGGPIQ